MGTGRWQLAKDVWHLAPTVTWAWDLVQLGHRMYSVWSGLGIAPWVCVGIYLPGYRQVCHTLSQREMGRRGG